MDNHRPILKRLDEFMSPTILAFPFSPILRSIDTPTGPISKCLREYGAVPAVPALVYKERRTGYNKRLFAMGKAALNTHETLVREEVVKGSSDRTLGLVFTVFFLAVGLLPLVRHHPLRPWALIVSAVFLVLALACPFVLKPLNYVWLKLGLLLHAITNPIILGALFYLVFTPFALVFRMMGKDFLRLHFDTEAKSYWLPRNPPGPPPESMINQF
jgi:hypothetical protein